VRAYCTICSAGKRKDPDPLPAIERYTSPRIKKVYELAKDDDVFFFILSGQYGPLLPTDEIPYYDHLLRPEEIRLMGCEVGIFIEKNGITELVLFLPPEEKGEGSSPLVPYRQAIQWGAVAAGGIPVTEKTV